tara:strand:+ start:2077 stop:2316 length:240 start_codon:yes stop_codon:yes gene_type:complete
MIETFFNELMLWNPLYWGGLFLFLFILFKIIKNLGKVFILFIILGLIAYTVHYFYPGFLEEAFKYITKQSKDLPLIENL